MPVKFTSAQTTKSATQSPTAEPEHVLPREEVHSVPFGQYRYTRSLLRPSTPRADENSLSPIAAFPKLKVSQRQATDAANLPVGATPANHSGLPEQLKANLENRSGMSFDHVKVHVNSSEPAQLNALAYAQGSDIHLAPGQERHLPHEAWHLVQQAQGRVKPTAELKGRAINDDPGLEQEAEREAANLVKPAQGQTGSVAAPQAGLTTGTCGQRQVIQRVIHFANDAKIQYTKDRYLTLLLAAAKKKNPDINFEQVRKAWVAAEISDAVVNLEDDFDLAWQEIGKFVSPEDVVLRPALTPEQEKDALDAAAKAIPMTERAGVDKHRAAVRGNVEIIFPPAREELDGKRTVWDEHDPAEFEEKLPGVDYTSWDNLLGWQKRFLLNNRNSLQRLMNALYAEVAHGKEQLEKQDKKPATQRQSRAYSDYILALFSRLMVLTNGDVARVAQAVGLTDGGKYLQTIFNIRRGQPDESIPAYKAQVSKESSAEKAAVKKGQAPIDWLNERAMTETLREDAPFLRQRAQKVALLRAAQDQFDVLKKWASGGSNVQSHHSNMDSDILATIAATHGKSGKQSPTDNFNLLDSLLAKITPLTGTLYAAYPRNDSLRPGYLFSQGTPMSASESAGGTVAFSKNVGGGADRYKIFATGHNAIPISAVVPGVGQGQREVLFRAQATFKVLSIEEGDFGANVTRQVTMIEQGSAISRQVAHKADNEEAVKASQQALLNERDAWLTKFAASGLDAKTQAWFISNSTGGRIEGQSDASFAFPYGRKTAQAWHEVITDDEIEIWTVDGFIQIAAKLLGVEPKSIQFIVDGEDPGSWGEARTLDPETRQILIDNGLSVEDVYSSQKPLSGQLLMQIALKAGAKPEGPSRIIMRLSPKQEALIPPSWMKTKVKDSEAGNTSEFKLSQKKKTILEATASGNMKDLLLAAAGGNAKLGEFSLASGQFQQLDETSQQQLKKTDKSKVNYKSEDKRAKLTEILQQGHKNLQQISSATEVGESDSNTRLRASARLAARIQQQLSVLHPLHDGNGRISRAYAYLILRRSGFGEITLPLFKQDQDQSTSREDWENQFAQSAIGGNSLARSGLDEEIGKIADEAAVIKFLQSHAGEGIKADLESVNSELGSIASAKGIETEDMWLVDEMLDYIRERPEWLSFQLKMRMDNLMRERLLGTTDNKEVFKQVLALKKDLVLEIVQQMQQATEKRGRAQSHSVPLSNVPASSSKENWQESPILDLADASPGFLERLQLQWQDAQIAVANGGQEQLAESVLNHYDAGNHGVYAHFIALQVFRNRAQLRHSGISDSSVDMLRALEEISADSIQQRLSALIIPRARLFYSWQEEVEDAQMRWVEQHGLGAGILWQQEMQQRTRLARAWVQAYPRYADFLDVAQRATVTDALNAQERAERQALVIENVNRAFVDGDQLTDGNCLFAALADPNQVDLEHANQVRGTVVNNLQDADVLNTPLAELRQMVGSSQDAQAARVAYGQMQERGISLLRYRAYMSISGVWGGDPEIMAWSRLPDHQALTVYLLEPGNDLFRGIRNGLPVASQNVETVLAAVNAGTALAIRNTGGHYIRMLPRPQLQPEVDLQQRVRQGRSGKDKGAGRKRARLMGEKSSQGSGEMPNKASKHKLKGDASETLQTRIREKLKAKRRH